MGNELVAQYYIFGKTYDIYGCWDNDTPENKFDFYDVYNRETGICINIGNPFYEFPSYNELVEYIKENNKFGHNF